MTESRQSPGRWIIRQGPVAALLAGIIVVYVLVSVEAGTIGLEWVLLSVVPLCGLALVAEFRPVPAALGAVAVLVGGSAVQSSTGAEVLATVGPLTLPETAAAAILITTVVRRTEPWVAAAMAGLLVPAVTLARWLRVPPMEGWPNRWWYDCVEGMLLLLFFMFAGSYLRHRDRERERATEQADTAARQRERLILARELHDVVAHHVGAMVVHAQAAQAVVGSEPDAGRRALPTIETTGREALDAMRRLVSGLREDDGLEATPTRTADLTADLRAITTSPAWDGPPVTLVTALTEPVPAEVASSVLRIVREAMTNARRHASGAHEIGVSVRTGDGVLRVRVVDDGSSGPIDEGYGLLGMRERTRLLGGRFSAGRTGDGGWQVTAEVPLKF